MHNIVNLSIKVGSEEVTMSLADAKKLYEELKVLFGSSDKYWPVPNTFNPPLWSPSVPPGRDVWYTTISSDKVTANVGN